MDLRQLKGYLDHLAANLAGDDQRLLGTRLGGLSSVFPFNEYEYVLTFLVDRGVLAFDEYEKLRTNYVSANRYLNLFGLSPRVFGQIWGEAHLRDLDPRFQKPSCSVDPGYQGQCDLLLDSVRVEVKAARAIDTRKRGDIVSKALHRASSDAFWMNFQQLKPDACDVFVFIGVWVDHISYWVLSSAEAKGSRYLSHQHRGGIEFQIGITNKNLAEFTPFECTAAELVATILSKAHVSH